MPFKLQTVCYDCTWAEITYLENVWRQSVYKARLLHVRAGLYHQLPDCVISKIAAMAYPCALVVEVKSSRDVANGIEYVVCSHARHET